MKALALWGIISLIFGVTTFFHVKEDNVVENSNASMLPDNVKSIFERSCFDCHSNSSKNPFAKGKVNFDELDDLKGIDRISVVKDIEHEVMSDKMPPKKYTKKSPEKVITEEEKEIINQWVNAELKAVKDNEN